MLSIIRSFIAAWRFLTILPFPFTAADELSALKRSAGLFPVVGCVLGSIAAAIGLLLGLLPQSIAAVLAVLLLALFSGGLHLDGLADSADALCSGIHGRDKALAVMRDSRIGAHGAMALLFILLLKYSCFVSLPGECLPYALFLAPLLGRCAMLFPMSLLPYVRESGLGKLFDASAIKLPIYACLWVAGGLLFVLGLTGFAIGGLLWLLTIYGWVMFLKKRLGGATGDTYGAACELGETIACVAIASLPMAGNGTAVFSNFMSLY